MVYTFYSYKGGVGRSMALANVAALLAMWKKRVLIVDWDLEAPGLQRFFLENEAAREESATTEREPICVLDEALCKSTPGMVDLVVAQREGQPLDWRKCVLEAHVRGSSEPVHLITAGRPDGDYARRLQSLNWSELFRQHGLGAYLEQLRKEWLERFDFVLIDSRTGISDIGGICTILLPDVLVLVFTSNQQSIDGVEDVMRRARDAQARMPIDRGRLLAVPLPSRDERDSHHASMAQRWIRTYVAKFGEYYRDWLPVGVSPEDAIHKLYIPYIARWSFGERLPVLEENTLVDPRSISAAYSRLAALLDGRLDWSSIEDATLLAARAETRRLADVAQAQAEKASVESERAKQLEVKAAQESVRAAVATAKASRAMRWLKIAAAVVLVCLVGGYYFKQHADGVAAADKILRAMGRADDPLVARILAAELRGLPEPENGQLAASVDVGQSIVAVAAIPPPGSLVKRVRLHPDGSRLLAIFSDGTAGECALSSGTWTRTSAKAEKLLDGIWCDSGSAITWARGAASNIVIVGKTLDDRNDGVLFMTAPGSTVETARFVGSGVAIEAEWTAPDSKEVSRGIVWLSPPRLDVNERYVKDTIVPTTLRSPWFFSADGTQGWTADESSRVRPFGLPPEVEKYLAAHVGMDSRVVAISGSRVAYLRERETEAMRELVCADLSNRLAEKTLDARYTEASYSPRARDAQGDVQLATIMKRAPLTSLAIVGDAYVTFADPGSWKSREDRAVESDKLATDRSSAVFENFAASGWFWSRTQWPAMLDHAAALFQEGWTEVTDVSADGRHAVTVGLDGTIWIWNLDEALFISSLAWRELIQTVTSRTRACLTPDQRMQHLDEELKDAVGHWEACERGLGREPSEAVRARSTRPNAPVQQKAGYK